MSKQNNISSLRTCIISNQQYEKSQLVRIVISDKQPFIDYNQKRLGRGHYIYSKIDHDKLDFAIENNLLVKKLKCKISSEFITELNNLISSRRQNEKAK